MNKWLYYYILDNETLSLIIQQRQILENFNDRMLISTGSCYGYCENISINDLNRIEYNRYISDVELDQEKTTVIHLELLETKSLWYQNVIVDEQKKFNDIVSKLFNRQNDCYAMIKKLLK